MSTDPPVAVPGPASEPICPGPHGNGCDCKHNGADPHCPWVPGPASVSPADTIRRDPIDEAEEFVAAALHGEEWEVRDSDGEPPTWVERGVGIECVRFIETPLSYAESCRIENLLNVARALLAVGERDKAEIEALKGCPAGEGCAINSGAVHCFHCRRNWPRDETWEQPFLDRPDLRLRANDKLHRLADELEVERERDRQQIARLTEALERLEPLQQRVLGIIERNGFVFRTPLGKPDNERTEAERWEKLAFTLYSELCEADTVIRAVLAGEEDARP